MTTIAPERRQNPKGEGAQLREEIIAAAREVLLQPQTTKTPSLRAVARACGISPTAAYRHFESQRALIECVVEDVQLRLSDYLSSADDDARSVREGLELRACAYVEWGLANPGAYELAFESEDRLGIVHSENGPGVSLIARTAELLRDATCIDYESAISWATRVWVNLHGLVSLRLHKPDDDYSNGAAAAALEIVQLHVSAMERE